MMSYKRILVTLLMLISASVNAGDNITKPKQMEWSFDSVLGVVDRQSAQRGFKVYKEVCAVCHSLKLLSYRNLEQIGFSKDEIKALASSVEVSDGPNDQGEMFLRPGLSSDHFPSPYLNEQAARAANNGAYPPDLSLIIKARMNGANYLYSLLTGFKEQPPKDFVISEGMYYNPYFSNKQIAMAPPLFDGQVEYSDNTNSSVEQMSKDIVNFLQWVSEPEMEQRKRMGIKVIIYLIIVTLFFLSGKKIIWRNIK